MTIKNKYSRVVSRAWYINAYDETLKPSFATFFNNKFTTYFKGAIQGLFNGRNKNKYIDFTNDSWKKNHYIGLQIVSRPYKFYALVIAVVLMAVTTVIPGPNILGFFLVPRFLRRFG